ncbi:MAG: P-type Cu+ transporter [Thermotogaceae bacterium]|nr:P-type Cu+ transporter [Thermotogaceae bacterium]
MGRVGGVKMDIKKINMEKTTKKEEKMSFSVTGMTCATCVKTVEKALSRLEGVKFAAVNLATSTGFIIAEKEIPFEVVKKAVEEVGYGVSEESPQEIEEKRYRETKKSLILGWLGTLPIAVLMLINMLMFKIQNFEFFELFVGGFVIFYAGRKTIKGAWIALTHKHTNMDTLIFFGSVASWFTTLLSIIGIPIASFGAIGAMIMTFHITGRFIESHLRDKAAKEIKALLKLQSKEATVITDKGEILVPIEAVKEGFTVLVKPGERIPIDGQIIDGVSGVDESMITGESIPIQKSVGEEVIGGSLNLTSPLKIKVTKVGEDTFLAQMIKLIQQAQGAKVPIQALADRITMWFVPSIITLAVLSSVIWYFNFERFSPFIESASKFIPWITMGSDPLTFSVFVFVATIVIACPCALGLATPMALVAGTGLAAKRGLIIKNAEAIQTAKEVKYVLMDKTGTLTEGNPKVVEHNLSEEEFRVISGIEKNSNHPLAKAVSSFVESNLKPDYIEEIPGQGLKAVVGENEYFIGRPEFPEKYTGYLESGKTVIEVYKNKDLLGYIVVEDPIRADSRSAVKELKNMNITPVMITGDNQKTARAVAKFVGIDEVYAQVRPADKLDIVRKYQAKGMKVVMAGDGMNDAAALKGADVGIAIGSGTDLAIDSADIIITKGGVYRIVDAIKISKKTFRVIKQNLFWAFFYNVVAIPMAMAGLLHPVIAEIAMAISSITVVLNSMKISRTKLYEENEDNKGSVLKCCE